jgi:hypothetical protein
MLPVFGGEWRPPSLVPNAELMRLPDSGRVDPDPRDRNWEETAEACGRLICMCVNAALPGSGCENGADDITDMCA